MWSHDKGFLKILTSDNKWCNLVDLSSHDKSLLQILASDNKLWGENVHNKHRANMSFPKGDSHAKYKHRLQSAIPLEKDSINSIGFIENSSGQLT